MTVLVSFAKMVSLMNLGCHYTAAIDRISSEIRIEVVLSSSMLGFLAKRGYLSCFLDNWTSLLLLVDGREG